MNDRDDSEKRHHRTIEIGGRRTSSNMIDRKTGSSFYDQTLKNQKI